MTDDQSVSYSRHIEVLRTEEFDQWVRKLKDREARRRILRRIDRLTIGGFGDARPVGRGVSELKENHGPGYRVYFLQDGELMILLLVGGNKSTQKRDIAKAHDLAKTWWADKKGTAHG